MFKKLFLGLSLVSALLLPSTTFAETKHPIASKDTVKKNCNEQGGTFIEGEGIYGCTLPSETRVACLPEEDVCISWKPPASESPSRKEQLMVNNQFGVSSIVSETEVRQRNPKLVDAVGRLIKSGDNMNVDRR
ncbi:hypothetical protein NIES4101_36130 [Calothrix sp. NIES-4101]|nr:hypothetical protein NIES4101_36130 [Calothrix sp. NIES-4101]